MHAQQNKTIPFVSKVWVVDKGNGTYQNPVLNADYSDPDAIRVGDDQRAVIWMNADNVCVLIVSKTIWISYISIS